MKRRVAFPAVLAIVFLLAPLAQGQSRTGTVIDTRPRGTYAIRGNVRFFQNEKPAEMIKIELRRFSGDMVSATITRSNGEFEFTGLGPGTYYLVVEESGFEAVRDQVEVITSSLFGVNVYLKKVGATPGEEGTAVSVRELSLPRDTRNLFRKALDVLYAKNKPKDSLPLLQKVLAASPDFYEANFHLGVAYSELQRMSEAEAAFRKAVTGSEGKYPQAMIALASLLITEDKVAEAESLARRAVALDATLWQGQYELGRALAALGRPAEAEPCLAETVKLRPDYAPAYLLLANIHIRLKNHSALLADLNEYLKLEPDGPQSAQARKMRDAIQQEMDKTKKPVTPAPPQP